MRRVLVVIAFLLAVPTLAYADDPNADLFAQANKDYSAGRYDAAIAKYEELVKDGVKHQDLYYNLGNAYYRTAQDNGKERLGRAILNFERALAIEPSFDDARYNLEVARELVGTRYGQDKVKDAAADPLWIRVATWLPLQVMAWLFLGLDALFFVVLIILRFLPSGFLRTGLLVGNVFCGIAGALVGILLAAQVYYLETVRMSVVVSDEVVMREGPDPTRREGPKLHAGHRAIVLREDHGWLRIRLANKMEGWVPKETIEEI